MSRIRTLAALVGLVLGGALLAQAASILPVNGPVDPSNIVGTINTVIQSINAGVPGLTGTAGVNQLDNGAMAISQRGTVDTTGGTTACTALTHPVDRWCVYTNVTSGAGHGQLVTSTPSPPPGFQRSLTIWRASGTLLQPICAIQEIPTSRTVQLQGKRVIFSTYLQKLAAMTGDAVVTATLITGTGSDQGLGTLTASPAITPAFTGVASQTALTTAALTTAWARYTGSPLTVPVAATEAAVALCFTPAVAGAGATDGFAMVGTLLEVAENTQTAASSYPHLSQELELGQAQRHYYRINETNGAVFCNGMISATNVQTVSCALPVTMRAVPAVALTAGGFAFNIAGTPTAVGGGFAAGATQTTSAINIVGAVTATVGQATQLVGTNTTGQIRASADF